MNANKQDAGGLPPLPDKYATVLNGREYYTPHQMRAYGELCRASPAGGDDLYRQACDSVEEWKARALEAEADIARIHAQINAENGPTFMGEPVVSAPAGSGEVEDENAANIESYAGVLERMALCNPRTADDFNLSQSARHIRDYAALLRKLQQGADYVMVPRGPTDEMETAHRMYGDTSDWWQAVTSAAIAAPSGRQGAVARSEGD